MLRVVVAVVLAVALVGVSMPAIEAARVDHADARVATELARVDAVADRLRDRNDPAPHGVAGARRALTLHLPRRTWGSAGLDALSIPGPGNATTGAEGNASRIAWRVEGGRRSTYVPSVRLVGPEGGLTLRRGGRQQLVLHLVGGRGAVVVRRPGFKRDDAARAVHGPPRTRRPSRRRSG